MNMNLLSGLPASGKTTWVNKWFSADANVIIHRDDFRAELRRELNTDEYFPVPAAEEYSRFMAFIAEKCKAAYKEDKDVFVDQTSLSHGSIAKFIRELNKVYPITNFDVITVHVIHTPFNVCMERNAKRTGHERVPDDVMMSMAKSFQLGFSRPQIMDCFLKEPEIREALSTRLLILHHAPSEV